MALGKLSIILDANISKFESDLGRAERIARQQSDKMKRQFDTAFKAIGVAAIAAAGSAAVFARQFNTAANSMVHIGQLAQGLGVSVGKFSALVEMMDDLGVNAEGTGVLIATLERNFVTAAQGSKQMAAAFKQLGVNIKGTNEPFALLLEMAKQIQSHGMTSQTAAALTRLFGSQAKTLGTLLQQGPEALKKATQEMLASGQAFTLDGYQKALQYYNAIDAISDKFTALKRQIVVGLAPAISELAQQFSDWVNGFVANGGVDKIKNAFTDIRHGVDDLRKGFALFSLAVRDAAATLAFFQTIGKNSGNIINNGRSFSPEEFAQNMKAELGGKKAPNAGTPFSFAAWKKQLTAQFQTLKDVYADNNAAAAATFNAIDKAGKASTDALAKAHSSPGGNIIDPNAATKAAALASAFQALAKASYDYTNSLTADTPLQKANAAMAAGVENLAKLREAYVKAGGSAKVADDLFAKGLAGLKDKFTFDLNEPQRQLEKYTDSLNDQLEAMKQANAVRLKGMTLSDREAQQMEALAADTADAKKAITEFVAAHQLMNGKLSDSDQKQLDALQTFLGERHKMIEQSQQAEEAIRGSFQDGVTQGIANFIDQVKDQFSQGQQFIQDFTGGLADAFVEIGTHAKSAKDAFGDFIDTLYADALRFVANEAISKFFEMLGVGGTHKQTFDTSALSNGFNIGSSGSSGGGWAGLISSFASLFGGGRAFGGPVVAGGMYEVNELGRPELLSVGARKYLMMGNQSGTVQPASQSRGFGGDVFNISVQPTSTRRTADQVATATARKLRTATARNG